MKHYWQTYSGVELDSGWAIYIDSSTADRWAIFKGEEFLVESDLKKWGGLVETLEAFQVPTKISKEIVASYLDFWNPDQAE